MAQTTTNPELQVPGSNKNHTLLRLACLGCAVICLTIVVGNYFSWEQALALLKEFSGYAAEHLMLSALIFAALQAVGMLFSLPTKGILSVLGGAIFGTWLGSAVTLAGTLAGTSLLFLAVRHLVGEQLQNRIHPRIRALLGRISRRPARFIAGLRLMVTLPYGPITIAAALTTMRFRDFLIGSLLGDIPIVVLYSAAGFRVSQLTDVSDVLSWPTALLLIGLGAVVAVSALLGGRRETNEGNDEHRRDT